ncbi:hypothetical protein [Desulfovibrio sp. TomC]|uniref:hypothetical protein n=1 Tax=Desulfovibrio sp. TomC TaxID=1562888 RepID=UPI000573EF18|nr:hypothetical protein [Desulfovibrio sp. TomC]KHK03669.1 hypothetical protein NY78_0725 [Desulfovibrio sp. TomC]
MDRPATSQPLSLPTRALYVLAAAVGYPPAFLTAYFCTMASPYGTVARGTNVVSLVLPVFALFAAAVFLARCQLWRILCRRFRPQAKTEAWEAFLVAHRPCLFMLPLTGAVAAMDMEGNVFGFLVFPLLLVASLVFGFWVQRRLWQSPRGSAGATQ